MRMRKRQRREPAAAGQNGAAVGSRLVSIARGGGDVGRKRASAASGPTNLRTVK